jgi:hypothetical protein
MLDALRARLAAAHRTAARLDAAANAAAQAAGERRDFPPAVHLADAAALSAAARVASLSARLFDAEGETAEGLEARRYAADLFAAAARARRRAAPSAAERRRAGAMVALYGNPSTMGKSE